MDSVFIWAQIVGFVAMAISIFAWQLKNPRHIILCDIPSSTLWAIQYFMLGASLGIITNTLCIARDGALAFLKDTHVPYIIASYISFAWLIGLYNFSHWYDILALIGTSIPALAFLYRANRPLVARGAALGCSFWFIYNIIVHSWMGAGASSFVIISSIIGMARHEEWILGRCHRTFMPSLARSLFVFPNFRTYP